MSRQSVLEAARALVAWHREIPAQVVGVDVQTLKGYGGRVAELMEQGRATVVDMELVQALCRAVDDHQEPAFGSHASDLAEMRAQAERADALERERDELVAALQRIETVVDGLLVKELLKKR